MTTIKQPTQPFVTDDQGILRFHPNAIVMHLLDKGGVDLNDLARETFPREDWVQFAQLIGYSIVGWETLSYVAEDDAEAIDKMLGDSELSALEARAVTAEQRLEMFRITFREPIAELYGIHPDNLLET